jgi:hypothetical protein
MRMFKIMIGHYLISKKQFASTADFGETQAGGTNLG